MCRTDTFTESLFTMRRLDDFMLEKHFLRTVRRKANLALKNIEPLLTSMSAADIKGRRPSVAPKNLLRAMLLQIFDSIRSKPLLIERTQYNLLFRWFIGLSMDNSVWVPKSYGAAEFIETLTDLRVLPHVAQNTANRKSAVLDRYTSTDEYVISQKKANSSNEDLVGPRSSADSLGDGVWFEDS